MEIAALISGFLGLLLLIFVLYKLVSKSAKANPVNFLHFVLGVGIIGLIFPQGFIAIVHLVQNFLIYSYLVLGKGPENPGGSMIFKIVFEGSTWLDAIVSIAGVVLTANLSAWFLDVWRSPKSEENQGIPGRMQIHFKNAFVAAVLTIALYFSMSAIIAIPVLSAESTSTTNLAEQLKTELDAHSMNDAVIKADYIAAIDNRRTVTFMDTALVDSFGVAEDFSAFDMNVKSAFRAIGSYKEQAVSRMAITDLSTLSPKFKLKDKSALSNWYHMCRATMLEALDRQQVLLNILRKESTEFSGLANGSTELDLGQRVNTVMAQVPPIPDRPHIGSDLGVFTFFSGWLLSVESQPLAVIIGLLGFGLLGASASTFIREFKQNNAGKPWIEDVAGVLIKGFTAAIVVFLGVQGSLAVLTTGSGELNAYALFFVSFVAAVFSDDAWKWAKSRFAKDFDSGNENPAATTGGTTETPAANIADVPPSKD